MACSNVKFDVDLSFLRLRNGDSSLNDTPIVLEGAVYMLFQVVSVHIIKGKMSARLQITAYDSPKAMSLSNGTLHMSSPDIKTYDIPLSRSRTIVRCSCDVYGVIEYQPVWCSGECTVKRREMICEACFSKSYWSLRALDSILKKELVKESYPPIVILDSRKPSSHIIQDGSIIIDRRDMLDTSNRCEGGHFLPLTLSILAVLSRSKVVKEEELYSILDDYNYHSPLEKWPYSRQDVKKCLRLCTYTLEYIDNQLDDDNIVTYRILPKGSSFISMFQSS